MNLLVFCGTYETYDAMDTRLDQLLADERFHRDARFSLCGHDSKRVGETSESFFGGFKNELAANTLTGDHEARKILGNLALRDNEFMAHAATYDFGGNEVALESWRQHFAELQDIQSQHPSYIWGLSRTQNGWMQFITYQFSHSGFAHLFWNMVFLLIFGTFVESELGPSFVVLTYVGSGVVGALAFSQIAGISSSPLVGASAAVSGLMALVGFWWLKRARLKFFYWVLPIKGYFGFALLPSWLILVVLLIPDLSGAISASPGISSVAYGAHIGGAVFGAFIAGLLAIGWMQIEVDQAPPQVTGLRLTLQSAQNRGAKCFPSRHVVQRN